MDGKELLERVVSTIQEMYLKLGDPEGAVSLYYPFEGDYPNLESEFYSEISGRYPGITVEMMSNRLRVLIPEEDCVRISAIPAKPTMKDLVDLTMARRNIDAYREHLGHNIQVPESSLRRTSISIGFSFFPKISIRTSTV